MLWLASYPRSGNTFFRIVLSEVYGIESSEYPVGPHKSKKPGYDYQSFEVIKTHSLPDKVVPADKSIPAVLLVRDGRDSLVSYANHWKDFTETSTDIYDNLRGAILAGRRSKFVPGWSIHVNAWLKRAALVIKFEDLITDPIGTVETLRPLIDLPQPDPEKLPSFDDVRTKWFNYGSLAKKREEDEQNAFRQKFFRKGQVGGWKEEMPEELHRLFWLYHGDAMDALGYQEDRIEFPRARKLLAQAHLLFL